MWIPRSIDRERKFLPMSQAKGKRRSMVQLQVGAQAHPFYTTLRKLRNYEVPVNCGPDWEWDGIKQAIA